MSVWMGAFQTCASLPRPNLKTYWRSSLGLIWKLTSTEEWLSAKTPNLQTEALPSLIGHLSLLTRTCERHFAGTSNVTMGKSFVFPRLRAHPHGLALIFFLRQKASQELQMPSSVTMSQVSGALGWLSKHFKIWKFHFKNLNLTAFLKKCQIFSQRLEVSEGPLFVCQK